jgi:hypothetical protein
VSKDSGPLKDIYSLPKKRSVELVMLMITDLLWTLSGNANKIMDLPQKED